MGGYDGEVRIKTSMDLKNLEKDIKEAEKKLRDYENEAKRLEKEKEKFYEQSNKRTDENYELKSRAKALREEAKLIEEQKNKRVSALQEELSRPKPNEARNIGITSQISHIEERTQKQIETLNQQADKLEQSYTNTFNEIVKSETEFEGKMNTSSTAVENQKKEIADLKTQYQQAQEALTKYYEEEKKQQQQKKQMDDMQKSIDKVGNSVKKVTRSLAGWGLRLIGINSIMGLVSKSVSLLRKEDKQLDANLNYISFALANAIKPIIEKIVNLVLKLANYVAYIVQALFGKNIFANSGIKDFEKSMKNSSKSAKQIKKDLMGFDEVNKLSENSSAGGGVGTPSMDLSKLGDFDKPGWLKWIEENPELVKNWLLGIAFGLTMIKNGVGELKAIGILLLFQGVVQLIEDFQDLLDDPSWSNFWKVIKDIGMILAGIALIKFDNIGNLIKVFGALNSALVIVALAEYLLYDNIIDVFNKIDKFLKSKIPSVITNPFQLAWAQIVTKMKGQVGVLKGLYENFFGGIRDLIKGIKKMLNGEFKEGVLFAIQGILRIMLAPFLAIRAGINAIIDGLNKIKIKIPKWVPKFGGEEWGFNVPRIGKIKIAGIELAKGGIINNPGQGVALGSNIIGGEAGAEAVLPLDDRTMDRLGQSIARHMSINATMINQMNGRTLSREIHRISNENAFTYNG